MELKGKDAFGWDVGVLFDIVDGFDSVDVELMVVALAADDVGVPAVFFEEMFEGAGAGELLAEDLRQAQQQLSEITGQFTSDDLLGRIFSSFCIGK